MDHLSHALAILAAQEELIYGVDEKNNIIYFNANPPEHRFADNIDQYVYKLTVGEGKGDSLGDMNFGMYYKVSFDPPLRIAENEESVIPAAAAILAETQDGIDCETYKTEEAAEAAWAEIELAHQQFLSTQGM